MDGCLARKVRLRAVCCAALWTLIAVAGCAPGDQKADAMSDIERVRSKASEVGGAATEVQRWTAIFVEGSAPADSEKPRYAEYMYYVPPGGVDIDGDSATATVQVEDSDENIVGETEWTLQKDADGTWRIETAPLPDGA